MDYDVIVIGSGFGGSVAALRLSEKGYRVAVIEMGRRVSDEDIQRANKSALDLFWMPELGLKGFFTQRFFQHVNIVGGVGVGGGSLVYAAVLLQPKKAFYQDQAWSQLGIDWEAELRPYYQTASRILGVNTCPTAHIQDEWLKHTAQVLGVGQTHKPVPLGIYFGEEGVEKSDPFFNGEGPARKGCILCGACLAGCANNAKNTLDKNYLHLAEKLGATILPERKATLIKTIDGGYEIEMIHPYDPKQTYSNLRAPKIILAGGVLGTLELLFRCKEIGSLPNLSPMLGRKVRTNSEAITGVLSREKAIDLTRGPAISSDFHANDLTHITQNRLPASYWFMKLYSGALVDGSNPLWRGLKALLLFIFVIIPRMIIDPTGTWHKRITLISTMQNMDNQMAFTWGRGLLNGFKKGLQSSTPSGKGAPTFIPEANHVTRTFANISKGIPHNSLLESVLNMSVTAHILGGCPIGADDQQGVIDSSHEVFGYPGMFIVDGSAIPANVGVNPSLTITAMAEKAMSHIPNK